MAVATDGGNSWRIVLVVAGSGHDLKWPRPIACVHVDVVGLKHAACRNWIALERIFVANMPLAVQAVVGVFRSLTVFHNPGGSRAPTRTTLPLSDIVTAVAEKVAMHPASQKVPMDSRAWPERPGNT